VGVEDEEPLLDEPGILQDRLLDGLGVEGGSASASVCQLLSSAQPNGEIRTAR
jgi:hypothetical protein